MKSIHFLLLPCCILSCLSGCSKQGNPEGRLDISGTVTFNGSPFGGAGMYNVAFEPVDDPASGPTSGTIDSVTGKYSCTMHDGLKPGKYRVKFIAMAQYDKRTKKPVAPDYVEEDLNKQSYYVALLPPDFNEVNTVEFEVVKGKKNVFDYNIETSYVPTP